MRQQLISWLMEDIAPEIKKTGRPMEAILKFSSEKNLPPAQVEALGQLFNTAKTVSFLEKSANRGATFPILDVPEMVSKYIDHRPKQATDSEDFAGPSNENDLPGCFSNLLGILDTGPAVMKQANENPQLRAFAISENARVRSEMIEQARFECQEDYREGLEKIATLFRENDDLIFQHVESQALAIDPGMKPVLDKVAGFLEVRHWPVTRGTPAPAHSLFDDRWDLMTKLSNLRELEVQVATATEMLKEASTTVGDIYNVPDLNPDLDPSDVEPPPLSQQEIDANRSRQAAEAAGRRFDEAGRQRNEAEWQRRDAERQTQQSAGRKDKRAPNNEGRRSDGKGSRAVEEEKSPSGVSRHENTFFPAINDRMDSAGKFLYGELKPVLEKAIPKQNNKDQRLVDSQHQDTKHIATLQNLMLTDDVLAEADPDKVVAIANTIREAAPSLAGDANVMRVILRSAVQHDGISPFDLKGFLDTELSKQKVDFNQRHMDAHLYKGKDLPGKPVS